MTDMSDWKRTCPACKSRTSSIGMEFADGKPCPNCGLPADAADAYERAVAKGVSKELADRMAAAEVRAAKAEEEVGDLRDALEAIRGIANGARRAEPDPRILDC